MRLRILGALSACTLVAACNSAAEYTSFDGCDGLRGTAISKCLKLAASYSPSVSSRGSTTGPGSGLNPGSSGRPGNPNNPGSPGSPGARSR